MPVVFIAARQREDVVDFVRTLPQQFAGTAPDKYGIVNAFKQRVAFGFLSVVKEEFLYKAKNPNSPDQAGISWPPLSKKYLAYQRGPKSSRRGRGEAPPGKRDGMLSKKEADKWWRIYRSVVASSMSQGLSEGPARERARAIAWSRLKDAGAKTKLEVFGNRPHEILRDRGLLFNSLSPGNVTGALDKTIVEVDGETIVKDAPGTVAVGTNVEYATYHQTKPGKRPFWPKSGGLPSAWSSRVAEIAADAFADITKAF